MTVLGLEPLDGIASAKLPRPRRVLTALHLPLRGPEREKLGGVIHQGQITERDQTILEVDPWPSCSRRIHGRIRHRVLLTRVRDRGEPGFAMPPLQERAYSGLVTLTKPLRLRALEQRRVEAPAVRRSSRHRPHARFTDGVRLRRLALGVAGEVFAHPPVDAHAPGAGTATLPAPGADRVALRDLGPVVGLVQEFGRAHGACTSCFLNSSPFRSHLQSA